MKIKNLLFTAIATLGFAVFSTAQTLPNNVPSNGLIGWWSFDGNANDSSGNNLDGNVIGSTELTNDRFGETNSAYDFDYANASFGQQNDEIQIPYDNLLDVNNITVSVWVYPRQYFWTGNNLNSSSSIIARWDVAPSEEVWGISFDSSSVKGLIVNPGGGVANGSTTAVENTPLTLNQWNHIVMTYDQVNIKLYVNGSLKATTPHNDDLNISTSGISIGERDQYNGYFYHTDGIIDDIGIWDRALSEQEVTNLYNETLTTIELNDEAVFEVYPNPTHNILNIKSDLNLDRLSFKIYDIKGSNVLSGYISDINTTINIEKLNSGIYILKIGEKTSKHYKIIKK